jgi:hypothetical protein
MKLPAKYIARSIEAIDLASVIGVLAILVAGLVVIDKFPPLAWVDIIVDDAYYYLGIARNLVDHGSSSFLPPFETNGYQPLWIVLLSGSALLFGTASKAMVVQIYTLSFVFILLFCLASKIRYGTVFPAVTCTALFFHVMAVGMETTMIPFLFILYMNTRKWRWKGVFGSALFFARLDALSLIVASDIFDLIKNKKIDFRKYIIIVPLILLYCAFNFHYFGTAVPVSGLAKAIGNVKGENLATGATYFSSIKGAIPIIAGILAYLFFKIKSFQLRYLKEITITLVATLMCAAYYSINSGWSVWGWYYWPILLLTYYLILEAVFIIKTHCTATPSTSILSFFIIGVALIYLSKPSLGFAFHRIATLTQFTDAPQQHPTAARENVQLVSYLRTQNIKPGSFFAMGDRAGSFGFFLGNDYRFIHTEGLVGPYSYYQAMRADRGRDFIDNLKLDYFVVDRGKLIVDKDVIGVIEPVQPLSSRFGDYVLCFTTDGIILDQSYYNPDHFFQQRYLIDFKKRTDCSRYINEEFASLRSRYGAIMNFSFPGNPG